MGSEYQNGFEKKAVEFGHLQADLKMATTETILGAYDSPLAGQLQSPSFLLNKFSLQWPINSPILQRQYL